MPKLPEPPESAFHAAARTGDIDSMASLLKQGADVNERRELEVDNGSFMRDLTPLMVAARSIDGAGVATLQWLIDHGADLRAVSEAGVTAAWYAAGNGGRWDFHPYIPCPDFVDRLQFLLDRGLDPNETSDNGRSLLSEACRVGDAARARLLLERGANPKASPADIDRSKALHDKMRETFGAISGGLVMSELVSNCVPHRAANARDSLSIPLFLAATSGSAECVTALANAGADLQERDASGMTALMHAGSVDVVNALVQAGLDANDRTPNGDDVLHVILRGAACSEGLCGPNRLKVARELVRLGARLDQPGSKFGNTRLYDAAFSRDSGSVALLLDLGCLPTADPASGNRTPLHAVCWQGEMSDKSMNQETEQVIRLLVAAGADVNAPDDHGSTPMHEAAEGDWGNATAVRTLLELGAAPDPTDEHGRTPLMLAADRAEVECIMLLLDAGADAARLDSEGASALHHARNHLHTWNCIQSQPPEFPELPASKEQLRDVYVDSLRQAEKALKLLESHRPR